MRFRGLFVLVVLAIPFAVTARSQDAAVPAQISSDPETTSVEDVVVVGATTHRAMGTYARTIAAGPTGRLSPRWNDSICVRVANMDAEHGGFLKERIETVAKAIGLSPDRSPTCSPNVAIYASNDPDALATTLIQAAPRRFQPARHNVSLGDAALERFRTSDAAVRWWQVSLPLMADSGQLAMSLDGPATPDPMALSVAVRNGSRLRGNVRDDLTAVTIILDVNKLHTVPFEAVSDYIAFVALAPADPRVETATLDTVLNLFDRPGVAGLTLMDQDYLYALYTASRAPASAALQAAEIADRMATERRRRGAAESQLPTPY